MDDSDGLFPEDGREMPIKKVREDEKGKEEEKKRERGFCKKMWLFYFLMVGLGA